MLDSALDEISPVELDPPIRVGTLYRAQKAPARRPVLPLVFQHLVVPVSPEVHSNRTVTFRFRDPDAKEVMLSLEGSSPRLMHRGAQGIWSITVGPLQPEYYGYSYLADGVPALDPFSPPIRPNLLTMENEVHVPGPPSLPWELNDVPHGVVHHIFYRSAVVGDNRDFYVYTPPAYDPRGSQRYPVLYLLHGYSDDASAWTAVGRANVILDNLIAQGKAKPMIVVMPLGYGAPEIVSHNGPGFHSRSLVHQNLAKFRDALLTEVIPQVQRDYLVLADRDNRAIAGLSMGGAEALYVGLNGLDRFAWIGSFSAGGFGEENFATEFPSVNSNINPQLHVLWIACGEQDQLVGKVNHAFRAWLDSKQIRYTNIWTPGMHTWMVWRSNLSAFAPLLFRTNAP
jgi:enterochelin esterase-like enzyme